MSKSTTRTRVSTKELTAMLTLFVATHAFLTYPRFVSATASEAAWMEPILSGVFTLVLFLIVERLLSTRFPGRDIVEVSVIAFGPWIAKALAVLFAVYFVCTTASVVREFSENVITSVLPNTPILVVGSVFMVAVAYIARAGLEGICRTAYIFLPILIIGTLGLCLLTVNWWEPTLLFPFWGSGPWNILYGAVRYSSIFANVLLLCVIYPHAHDPKAFRKIGILSVSVSIVLLVGFILAYHMVFSASETGKSPFALYELARMIDLGRFIQRLESVFVFLWVTAATVKMAVTLWGAAYLLSKAMEWPTFKPAIPALSLLTLALSLSFKNLSAVINWDDWYLISWGGVIVFGLPLLIVVAGTLREGMRSRRQRGVRHA